MQIIPVNDKSTAKQFLQVPVDIYKDDPNFIRPLDKDIGFVFNPKKNKYFQSGELQRWILIDENGNLIGRVAAFIDKKVAYTYDQPTGGMGFFECINDQKAAFLLFDTCKIWLQERGMEAMDGPVNFGERNRWWGLLVEGNFPPTYSMNYNPAYYRELFENYGFKNYFEQYIFSFLSPFKVPERFQSVATRTRNNPRYRFEHMKKSNLEKYARDFCTIFNNAWVNHHNFEPMTNEQIIIQLKEAKPIIIEELAWFAYYDDEPIAFFVMLPDINPIVKKLNGKFNWFSILKLLYYFKIKKITRTAIGIVFGVVPEHQAKGVEGALIQSVEEVVPPMNIIDELEMNWIGDFNPTMVKLVRLLGTNKKRTYITFRKLFDESKEFKRAPVVD
jgi:GNAT superfamily N-acetyltransferase